ncbi:ribosomal protein S5 domain 2-like protein [Myriangium duriaei CBS 260.36]|uniref:Ribosomal protein S5 domain 2-like protein n=1 Tax=Myriangium duriaei CBS 260.36 TaxID=1168546 RepID=A0A9P4IVU4_9PEZI|nr:ribosomal protein S5 domain 2-like protein [Myriangium duriaei CBS 260.36]
MPRDPEPSLNERSFLLQSLQSNLRLDSRPLLSHRPLKISFGSTPGLADITLGRTRVAARISCTVTTPFPDRKFDGIFTLATELSPAATPAFEASSSAGSSSADAEALLSRLLEKTIRRSGALDTESLCIVAGEKCFALRADVHVLDFDGNLVDAACLAVVAGLLHFRRPDVEVRGGEVRVFDETEREPVRLNMNHVPLCVSFSVFRNVEGEEILVLDATLLEEQCRDAEVVVGMNRFGEVVQIAKYGGYSVDPMTVLECSRVALEKVKWLNGLLMEKLDEEEKKRNVDGLMAELRADNERIIPG